MNTGSPSQTNKTNSDTPPNPPSKEGNGNGPATAKIRSYLGKRLRIVLSDKRVIIGKANCFDKDKNIILLFATESKSLESSDEAKPVGQVMVPGNHIISIEVEKSSLAAEN